MRPLATKPAANEPSSHSLAHSSQHPGRRAVSPPVKATAHQMEAAAQNPDLACTTESATTTTSLRIKHNDAN